MNLRQIRLPPALGGAVMAAAAVCLMAQSLAPPAALADSPLPTPTRLTALHVADTSADLDWLSSGSARQDVLQRQVNGVWQQFASGLFGFDALTNLTPGATYTFRVYSVAFEGSGFTDSVPSAPLTFTTLPAPDSVPPSKPPAPLFSSTTTTQTSVFWGEATDNVQVTGYYLQELVNGSWATIKTVDAGGRFTGASGLAPATTYSFAVVAFDARGNTSARSDPATVTTLPTTPLPACQVQVQAYNPSFTATVTIINTTTAPLSGWTVAFTMPPATGAWAFNSVLTPTATGGTLTAASYNPVIGTGVETFVGFQGSITPFTPPSAFTLNGQPCTSG